MFQKLSKTSVRRFIRNTKNSIGHAYNYTKNILGDVDSTVKLMKDIYSISQPAMESLVGPNAASSANQYIKQGLSGYESIRNKVMESDQNLSNHMQDIIGKLQKKQIDIGL